MLYSQYVRDIDKWFWQTAEGQVVRSKLASKEVAARLGIPVPLTLATLTLPQSAILKPDSQHSGRGVTTLDYSGQWIVEEQLRDENGGAPRTFRFYLFHGEIRLYSAVPPLRGGGHLGPICYYTLPDWQPAKIDRQRQWYETAIPMCLYQMEDYAARIAAQFRVLPSLRVDFFATPKGAVFNELAATPGMVMGNRIDPQWDRSLGQWLEQQT